MSDLLYRRILLKLSGEALKGSHEFGLDAAVLEYIAYEVRKVWKSSVEMGIVVGGGNIYRGCSAVNIARPTADYMGMLATVMNALALKSTLERVDVPVEVMSAVSMVPICSEYMHSSAVDSMSNGRVVIFACGSGNPYFTTDTAATLRALEMSCDVLVKATKVDGVFNKDPVQHHDASLYTKISHAEVLNQNLAVMDKTAIALAEEHSLPIMVYSMLKEDALVNAIRGCGVFSLIS